MLIPEINSSCIETQLIIFYCIEIMFGVDKIVKNILTVA